MIFPMMVQVDFTSVLFYRAVRFRAYRGFSAWRLEHSGSLGYGHPFGGALHCHSTWRGIEWLDNVSMKRLALITPIGLIITLVLLFAFNVRVWRGAEV